jgi:class 3 adenylate cyclase
MLRTTIIVKIDWVRSSDILQRMTPPEFEQMLNKHAQLVASIVGQYHGTIIKGEGDAYWMTFPAVTTAAQASIAIQRELSNSQKNVPDSKRLHLRIAIAAGDVLHKDGDLFGLPMTLTARIESVTPADAIYMSHGAWQLLNHAEIKTEFVENFPLKGIPQTEPIYRVVHRADMRVINATIGFTDMRFYTHFVAEHDHEAIVDVLTENERLGEAICASYGGELLTLVGDGMFFAFESATNAIQGLREFGREWRNYLATSGFNLPMTISLHAGEYFVFRSYFFGNTVNQVVVLNRLMAHHVTQEAGAGLFTTDVVASQLKPDAFPIEQLNVHDGELSEVLSGMSIYGIALD